MWLPMAFLNLEATTTWTRVVSSGTSDLLHKRGVLGGQEMHDIGGWTASLELARHEAHRAVDVMKKGFVSVAQIV